MPSTLPAPANPAKVFSLNPGALTNARPQYQGELIKQVIEDLFTGSGKEINDLSIADIGAGTGAVGGEIIKLGCCDVKFVEPDSTLCDVIRRNHTNTDNKVSIHNGSGENTGLEDSSVDLIVMGDASHWISPAARTEFTRVLKPGGKVANFVRFWSPQSPVTKELHRLLLETVPTYVASPNQFVRDMGNLDRRVGRHLISEEDGRLTEYTTVYPYSRDLLLEYFQGISSTAEMAVNDQANFQENVLDKLWDFARNNGYLDDDGNIKVPFTTCAFFGSPRVSEVSLLKTEAINKAEIHV